MKMKPFRAGVYGETFRLDIMDAKPEPAKAAQVRYDELKETLADAESLAMTGQPQQTMKTAQEVQWFTPWGARIKKQ